MASRWVGSVGLVFTLLLGCQTTDTSNVKDDSVPEDILIVYMGGYNSCAESSPDDLYAIHEFEQIKTELTAYNINVHWVLACYDGMNSTLIRWKSCDEPNNIYAASWDSPHSNGQVFREIGYRSADHATKVFVIGHSYGGWLASNYVASLGRWHNGEKKVEQLFTIDAISPYHCNQVSFANTVISGTSPGRGCERAPPQYRIADGDLYPDSMLNNRADRLSDYIRSASTSWTNFYQTRDYLHSSAVGASWMSDIEIRYLGRDGLFIIGTNSMPHIRIHRQPEVWSHIRRDIYDSVGYSVGYQFQFSGDETVITIEAEDPLPEELREPAVNPAVNSQGVAANALQSVTEKEMHPGEHRHP